MVFLFLLLGTRYLMPLRPAGAVAAAENFAYFE
jgi:hypothetical protein